MSAFLCNPHHIATLAHAFHNNHVYADSLTDTLDDWARNLAFSNYSAIQERYDDETAQRMADGQTRSEYMSTCVKEARNTRPQYSLIQLLKAIDCYEYQACEYSRFRDDIAPCLNKGHTARLRAMLIQTMAGYDAAEWELVA